MKEINKCPEIDEIYMMRHTYLANNHGDPKDKPMVLIPHEIHSKIMHYVYSDSRDHMMRFELREDRIFGMRVIAAKVPRIEVTRDPF